MGRAPLGAAAKDAVGSLRITDAEKKYLIAKYGSVAKALRKLVNDEMRKELAK